MFTTKRLNTLSDAVPPSNEKAQLTMLFSLIDGLLQGELSHEEFVSDVKSYLVE